MLLTYCLSLYSDNLLAFASVYVFVVQKTVFITIHCKTRISKHLVNELNGSTLIGFGP